jgi:hypothetical protein
VVPQVVALALLGAGLYAGYRWLARTASEIGAEMHRAEDEIKQKATGRIEKNLGTLEFDPASGVYRPVKRD